LRLYFLWIKVVFDTLKSLLILKNKKMKHVFTLTLLLLCGLGFAQNQLSGQVLIQENNETYPLTGASIYWLNTSEGTVSNEKGGFTLPMSDKTNRLIIQYLGFKTDTLTVDSSQKIIHVMKEEKAFKSLTWKHKT
jgi:outer membrane receptor for ferrienterochelin and colicins